MSTVAPKLYSYDFKTSKTYIFAALFVAGNVILPQLAHFVTPNGGPILLPIYFCTLIAAYKYGLKVGLLTAVLSPVINHIFFGMPPLAFLPVILIKSVLLATAAAFFAKRFGKVSLLPILLSILSYQLVGTVAEWIIVQDFYTAVQDFRIGIPGMLIQLVAGFALLKTIEKI